MAYACFTPPVPTFAQGVFASGASAGPPRLPGRDIARAWGKEVGTVGTSHKCLVFLGIPVFSGSHSSHCATVLGRSACLRFYHGGAGDSDDPGGAAADLDLEPGPLDLVFRRDHEPA